MGVKVQKYSLKCTEMTPDGKRDYTLVDEDQFLFVHDRMVQEIMSYYYDNRTDDSAVFITDNSGTVIHRHPDNAKNFRCRYPFRFGDNAQGQSFLSGAGQENGREPNSHRGNRTGKLFVDGRFQGGDERRV